MSDIFIHDIFTTIAPPEKVSYSLEGLSLPSNQDVYFMSKWHEIFERYQSARIFLRKAYEEEWRSWFNPAKNIDDKEELDNYNNHVKWIYKAELYETALINYNILVDLSWTITYVSAEYMIYKFDKDGNVVNAECVQGMHTIDDAVEILRRVENGTVSPTSDSNPFAYLKKMVPEFTPAVDRIVEFWRWFGNSNIRGLYNFIKHKGKPRYNELDQEQCKVMAIFVGKDEYPSDIRDVQKKISIEDGIRELIDFDNKDLFLYLEGLIKDLKCVVNPSPIVM